MKEKNEDLHHFLEICLLKINKIILDAMKTILSYRICRRLMDIGENYISVLKWDPDLFDQD